MSLSRVSVKRIGQLPHDEDELLRTVAMHFKVEGMAFKGFALVANLSDWTHAATGACLRVEYRLEL